MRKFLSALVAFAFIFGSSSAVVAAGETIGDPDVVFELPEDVRRGLMGVFFNDQETGEKTSNLIDEVKRRDNQIDPTCNSLQDASCISNSLSFRATIPFCLYEKDLNCIEEVGAIKADGTKVAGDFKQYFPLKAQNEFLGDPTYQLPSGTAKSLISIPGFGHNGGENYLVTVQLIGSVDKKNRNTSVSGFLARIVPIKLVLNNVTASSCYPGTCDTGWVYHEPIKSWGDVSGGSPVCEATSIRTRECAQKQQFPENIRFYFKARLNALPTGWLHGRFADPDVMINVQDGITKISVEALPVRVPVVYKSYIWPDVPDEIKAGYDQTTGFFKLGNRYGSSRIPNSWKEPDPAKRNFISTPLPSGETGIDELKLWIPIIQDKATALTSIWSVRTLSSDESKGSNSCFDSKSELTGLVTTNATQYSPGPPSFDKSEGILTYRVAAPHFDPTANDFKGSYDLVMRSDVARCLYGFSKAPINATLSITSENGIPQVATTLIGERNGWLYLQAKNFEFSAPIIKAKLSQEAEIKVIPTPTPSASAKAPIKAVTLTCIKGKMVKKVTAAKPKCPKGYKKKSRNL
jgi:hypothetical protein